ncbi:VapC toxin family PIN domain ribonuclease, partial [Staphylococcus aureus]
MLCVDGNVLAYAQRADPREHADYRGLFERLANDYEPLGLPG